MDRAARPSPGSADVHAPECRWGNRGRRGPSRRIRRRGVGSGEEIEQHRVRVAGGAHRIVGENELAEGSLEAAPGETGRSRKPGGSG